MGIRHLALAIAAAISFPVAGYAQESSPTVTRAQVRAELVQLESVGYWPGITPTTFRQPKRLWPRSRAPGRASAAAWVVCAAGRPLRATASPRVQRSTRFTRITDWQRLHHPMKHA
jgi:hypothetical protein